MPIRGIGKLRLQGRSLPWFQSVVPELIPGVTSDLPWLEDVRQLLWEPKHYALHDGICQRNMILDQQDPLNLPTDDFGLWRYWSVFTGALQPTSVPMAEALNEVSCVLGRTDCMVLGRKQEQSLSDQCDTSWIDYDFVVVRQALQDKVISPIINELTLKLQREGLDDCKLSASTSATEGTYGNVGYNKQPQLHKAPGRHHLDLQLRNALRKLRTVLIDEKQEHDEQSYKRKRARSLGEVSHSTSEAKKQK
ncbi:hypothetical protein NX059_006210 [Plenodomus lindquistii]|nr:hypothetical protein NX059_006210 [Plenodomus lindquistii]